MLAFALGWILEIDPLEHLTFTVTALVHGTLAAVTMFVLFLIAMRQKSGPFRRIRDFLVQTLGQYFADCRWYDLAVLAIIAGLSEELLFRGVLQVWIARWGLVLGLIGSNVLFGLAHAVTPTYAVFAGILGAFLGWLFHATGEPNLTAPIIAHALYDWLAFLFIARISSGEPPDDLDGADPLATIADESAASAETTDVLLERDERNLPQI